MKKIILAILATAFVTAQAYAFEGTIGFSGSMFQTTNFKTGVTTNHFAAGWVTQPGNTGDYAVVPGGVSVVVNGFSFTGNNTLSPSLTAPVIPQWTFTYLGTTYSFDLTVLTSASSTSGSIAESGTGVAHINGQSVFATWSLDGTGHGFTFMASIHTTALPDGGSAVALLGIALTGIEVLRRRLRIG